MSPDKIIVILSGIAAIGATYWFFLMKKDKATNVSGDFVDIAVSGGYEPEVISIPAGKTTVLRFTRTDPTECLGEVVICDFKIRKELPMNKKVSIEVIPQKPGEYKFTCGMNMYHGKIVVK